MLKSRFAFLLLLGAFCGLLGLQAAYALGPAASPTVMAASHSTPPGTDCADMATQDQGKTSAPCKGLTLDCVAQMGCVVPMTIAGAVHVLDDPLLRAKPDFWPVVPVLAGGTIVPEPHPPSILA